MTKYHFQEVSACIPLNKANFCPEGIKKTDKRDNTETVTDSTDNRKVTIQLTTI